MIHLAGINPAEVFWQRGLAGLSAVGVDVNQSPLIYYRTTDYLDQLPVHAPEIWFRAGDLVYYLLSNFQDSFKILVNHTLSLL